MSLLAALGWVILGGMAAGFLVTFWDEIREWLNHTAANAVEKVLGYKARQTMHRAVATVDRVMDKVRSTATVYAKKNELDTNFIRTKIVAEAEVYEIDDRILNEIKNKGSIAQEFEYKG